MPKCNGTLLHAPGLKKVRANYSRKVMVEGKGLVDCAPNLAWRDLSAHEVANRRFPWPSVPMFAFPVRRDSGGRLPAAPAFPIRPCPNLHYY